MGDQLSDIRQYVLDNIAGSSSDPMYSPALLDRTINVSNKRLGREFDWPWLVRIGTIPFLASVGSYTLTGIANYRHTKYLSMNSMKLAYKAPQELVRYSLELSSQPFFYTIIGDTLKITPVPTAGITLDHVYIVDENDLTDDNSTVLLPAVYTQLLVLKTLVALLIRSKDSTRLAMAKAEYKEALMEARDEVRRTRQLPRIEADESIWRTI